MELCGWGVFVLFFESYVKGVPITGVDMTIRRRHAPGHIAFTKGHSALRQRTYGVPGRRTGLESDDLLCETYVPRPVMPGLRKVHHSHESDYLTSQVDRASYLSHATLDEADDIVSVSRARDQQLLQSANSAIPPSISRTASRTPGWKAPTTTYPVRRFQSSVTKPSTPLPSASTHASEPLKHSLLTRPTQTRKYTSSYLGRGPPPAMTSSKFKKSPSPVKSSRVRDNLIRSFLHKTDDKPKSYTDYTSPYTAGNSYETYSTPLASPNISPYQSRRGSLVEYEPDSKPGEYGNHIQHWYTHADASDDGSIGSYRRRRKHRVRQKSKPKGSWRSYYNKLINRRAARPGSGYDSKYWPYYSVESLASDDIADLDDLNSVEGYGVGNRNINYRVLPLDTDSDLDFQDAEHTYVPSPGALELSLPKRASYRLPDVPDLSVVPYVPRSLDGTISSSPIANDLLFSSVVAAAAARAKTAAKNYDLSDYDAASVVFSIEGDIIPPRATEPISFRYMSSPIPVKGPPILSGDTSYKPIISSSGGDMFMRYFDQMRELRRSVRDKFDKADDKLTIAPYRSRVYLPELPSISTFESRDYGTGRKRQEDADDEYKTNRLLVYPYPTRTAALPAPTRTAALPSTSYYKSHSSYTPASDKFKVSHEEPEFSTTTTHRNDTDSSKKDSKDFPMWLTTLDRIQIKVKGGAPSTMKALVATKRVTGSTPPARVYQPYQYAAPPPPLRKVGREVAIKSVSEKPIIYFLPSSDSSSPRKPVIIARSNTGASAQSTTGFGQVEKLTREVARPIAEAKEIAARSLVKQRAAVNYSARLKRRHETVVQKQPEVLRVKKHPPLPHYTLPKKSGRKGRRSQAALVAGKVDIERSSRRSRRPKSQYAAEKYRQIRIDQAQDSPKTTSASGGDAAGSRESEIVKTHSRVDMAEPVIPRKKNLMSWQYRLDCHVKPNDLIKPAPVSFGRMRQRVREVQDKMDKTRQLYGRYLPEESYDGDIGDLRSSILRRTQSEEHRSSGDSKL